MGAAAGDLERRLHRGGLPPFYLAGKPAERDYQEWLDAYWARDIQELFRLEKGHTFQKFLELLPVQSRGMYEATRFARECEASRPTMNNYLAVLEATHVVHVLRPFSQRRATFGDRVQVARSRRQLSRTGDLCAALPGGRPAGGFGRCRGGPHYPLRRA